MSYELKIDPKQRASGRFIGLVRKSLLSAALDEREKSGVTQQEIADRIGVNRSVINRLLRGKANLTLRTVGEIAWALGYVPYLTLERRVSESGSNHFDTNDPPSPSAKKEANRSHGNFLFQETGRIVMPKNRTSSETLEVTNL